jgi:hypothetical protein
MILILFFVAFAILIYLFISTHRTVVVYEEPAPVSWWAWPITSYNWWPYWNGSYGGSSTNDIVHHKGPRHTPHHESRPWGGASRYANASAPSRGGHSAPSGGSHGGHGGSGHGGSGPSGGGHR